MNINSVISLSFGLVVGFIFKLMRAQYMGAPVV